MEMKKKYTVQSTEKGDGEEDERIGLMEDGKKETTLADLPPPKDPTLYNPRDLNLRSRTETPGRSSDTAAQHTFELRQVCVHPKTQQVEDQLQDCDDKVVVLQESVVGPRTHSHCRGQIIHNPKL